MLSAQEARQNTALATERQRTDTGQKLMKVINAASEQGSVCATFYPRNTFEQAVALELLEQAKYVCHLKPAKDQRDNTEIRISWAGDDV